MSHGLREWDLKRVIEAMREPRARPSKVSVGSCQYRLLSWILSFGELTVECDGD